MKSRNFIMTGMLALTFGIAQADGGGNSGARLSGFNEVPVVSTAGTGKFRTKIDMAAGEIKFELAYDALEGNVAQAHIHLGNAGTNGGVMVFLCTNLGNFPVQECPPPPAIISGTIRAADVIGPAAQGIEPGEFRELVRAIRAGAAYVNIHSDLFPGGELRGQIKKNKGKGK